MDFSEDRDDEGNMKATRFVDCLPDAIDTLGGLLDECSAWPKDARSSDIFDFHSGDGNSAGNLKTSA
jgi:hypothetical protein